MTPSRTRTFHWTLCLVLALLAIRPIALVDRLFAIALAPTRVLAELAGPIGWLQSRRVLAAGPGDDVVRAEVARHHALEQAVLDSALPSPGYLPAGARAVHAEVIGRRRDDLDTIEIRVEDMAGLRAGLPVVSGDCFVGLTEVLPDPGDPRYRHGLATVRLITARDSRIGALSSDESSGAATCQMVVGALAPRADALHLDVHNPADRSVQSGEVVVYEPEGLREGLAYIANGFLLGDLVLEPVYPIGPRGEPIVEERFAKSVLGVRPRLDYATGLYQVLVLTPDAGAAGPARQREDVLEDGLWTLARMPLRGEPSPWREGRKLGIGTRHGVRAGAALASGARLVGRVLRSGPVAADVALLADPGFSVLAIAMVETGGEPTAHVLGRLRGLGRARDGTLRFEWPATLPLAGAGEVRAEIWTGSGERGVPRGLLIGASALPRGAGPHVLHVSPPDAGAEPARIAVRLGAGERGS
ncbi:MAG: hypothetical protein GY711_14515 [bacterium]|nr:hypothetical protein [bacterium]